MRDWKRREHDAFWHDHHFTSKTIKAHLIKKKEEKKVDSRTFELSLVTHHTHTEHSKKTETFLLLFHFVLWQTKLKTVQASTIGAKYFWLEKTSARRKKRDINMKHTATKSANNELEVGIRPKHRGALSQTTNSLNKHHNLHSWTRRQKKGKQIV